jgi:tetratricopeptide (TPR) repeat protein
MAECYEKKNDPQTALVNWQKAIAGNGHVPYWHFRYGKLLLDRGNATEAAPHLTAAVDDALKPDVKPPWLAPAELAAAEALNRTGKRAESITMYRRFLEIASMNDPDRRDAIKALANMGETYRPGGR